MFDVLGVQFKSQAEFCKALGYKNPLAISIVKRDYGSWDHVAITRLRMQGRDQDEQRNILKQALQAYREKQASGIAVSLTPPTPAELTFKAALRLAIEVIEDQTLKTAAISCGTSYRPEQLRGALKVFAENFDLRAAVQQLIGSAGD